MFDHFEFYLQRKMKRLLLRPFPYWRAYRLGIIDKRGKKLREPFPSERQLYNVFDELIRRIIRLFMKYTPQARGLARFKMFKEFLNEGFIKSLNENKGENKQDYLILTEEWIKEYIKRGE